MNRSVVYLIYNLLLPLGLLIGLPRLVIKGIQRGGLARNFRQRFGRYGPGVREKLARPGNLWIHAVSVGEVIVALKLIRELHQQRPAAFLVLSTTTTTGFSLAEKETASDREHVTVIHNPLDLPWIVSGALRLIRPQRLILVEAEVWPNLVRHARRLGIPVILVNARLSDRSESRFRKFAALTRPIFSQLDQVCVPFESDIDRWAGIGVARGRIALTGSVKFDETQAARPGGQIAELRCWLSEHGVPADARVLLAGSTHAGEEALIGRAVLALRQRFPDLVCVFVPRHAERARAAAADLRAIGFAPVLKKPLKGETGPAPEDGHVPAYLANTTGELRAWYSLSDVVIIGKSFLGRGGQNPVEPIAAGKPVIVGPHMENFRPVVADLVAADGLLQIPAGEDAADPDETALAAALVKAIARLLSEPVDSAALAKRGAAALARHRGATSRSAALILEAGTPSEAGEKIADF